MFPYKILCESNFLLYHPKYLKVKNLTYVPKNGFFSKVEFQNLGYKKIVALGFYLGLLS